MRENINNFILGGQSFYVLHTAKALVKMEPSPLHPRSSLPLQQQESISQCESLSTSAVEEIEIEVEVETTALVGMDEDQSRAVMLTQLEDLRVDAEAFEVLTLGQLSDLLFGLRRALVNIDKNNNNNKSNNAQANQKNNTNVARTRNAEKLLTLSSNDKKILKALLESGGRVGSAQLSTELDIPLSTIQRRRQRLEEGLIDFSVFLRYEKLARKQVAFFVYADVRSVTEIGKDILAFEEITTVIRTLGSEGDLRAEAVLKTNEEIANLCEKIKSVKGVTRVSWIESIEVLGKNKGIDSLIIKSA